MKRIKNDVIVIYGNNKENLSQRTEDKRKKNLMEDCNR